MNDFTYEIIKLTGTCQKVIHLTLPLEYPKQRRPDITKVKEILYWNPKIGRPEGLRKTYDYFRSFSKNDLESNKENKILF